LAETLVALTALRTVHRANENGTVIGPVDAAIMSKSDEFTRVKRKAL
jgi:hypothetical protein